MNDTVFEEIFTGLTETVRQKFAGVSGCHDFDHTRRVLRNAGLLADELAAADRRIVRLGALLHDWARPEELAARGALCHAALGAELVPGVLAGRGLPETLIRRVAAAVRTHRYRDGNRPETVEAEIVYDADKLDSLGAVGVGRAFLFAGREHAKLHNDAATALASPPYGPEDTAYREYLVKLRHLPDAMLTAPGRRLAGERAAFMTCFFDRLIAETGVR